MECPGTCHCGNEQSVPGVVNHAVASLSALNIRNHATTVTRSRPSSPTLNPASEIPDTLGQPTVTKVPLGQPTRYPRPTYTNWDKNFVEAITEMEQDPIGEGMDIEQVPEGIDRPQPQSMCCYLRRIPHRHPRQNPTAYCTSPSSESSPILPNLDHKWHHTTTSSYFTHTATPTPNKNPHHF